MEVMKSADVADSKQEQEQHFHVLAVDDSLIDRKLLERLLKGSSYKGIYSFICIYIHISSRKS